MAADEALEYGEDVRRGRLIDRLLGDPARRLDRQISLPALAAAVIAVGLFAVAEMLPWIFVQAATLPQSAGPAVATDREATIEGVGVGAPVAYYIALVLLLMVL